MILIKSPDLSREVVRPIKVKRIYGEETLIEAAPELIALARELDEADDPLSDGSIALILRSSADYIEKIGYADNRFRDRRDLIFTKKSSDGALGALASLDGLKNMTTLDLVGREYSVTVSDGMIVSAAAAYRVQGAYEICVETAKEHRGRGYASANVKALADRLISRGERVLYLCSEKNERSIAVAERAGFFEIGKRYEYVVRRKGKHNGI